MKLRYTEQAQADIDTAVDWYESQSRGLGLKFLNNVEDVVERILEYPKLYSLKRKRLRAASIKIFPFTIFYSIEKALIVIHSVFDDRQNPEKRPGL